MPPATVCHLSAAGTPTASWPSALSGRQCRLRLSATSALPELQPRPGPVPSRAVNASCGCLPPQRCRYSNRVLVQFPFRFANASCGCLPPQRRGHSNRVLARGPCPQVLQRHPGVAKGTSIDPLARGPSTEPLLGQGRVARLSGSGVKPVSCRCFGRTSARHPRREASRWHPGVAKGTSIDPLARGPSAEPLLGQGHVARLSGTGVKPVSCRCFGRTSARHPLREASRWHPGVARQSSIGFSSIKCRCSMDIEVRIGCLSMKCRCFMDVEVRMGCSSIKCHCFMEVP